MVTKEKKTTAEMVALLKASGKVKNSEIPNLFKPYQSRGIVCPGESWQEKLLRILAVNKKVKTIFVLAANAVGKTEMGMSLLVDLARGEGPLYERFKPTSYKPLKAAFYTANRLLLSSEGQAKIEYMTEYKISLDPAQKHKDIQIIQNNQNWSKLINKNKKVEITFSTVTGGIKAVKGMRPSILIVDEPPSEAVWGEMQSRGLTMDSILIMTATPAELQDGWVVPYIEGLKEEYEHIPDEESPVVVIHAATWDNPHVALEEIEARMDTFGGPESQLARLKLWGDFKAGYLNTLDGIKKCIVKDDWWPAHHAHFKDQAYLQYYHPDQLPWYWLEVHDYGSSAKDPFFATWYRIFIEDGLIIQEAEAECKTGKVSEWVDLIHNVRNRLNLPPQRDYKGTLQMVHNSPYYYAEPDLTIGDKQYLARSSSVDRINTIQDILAEHGVNPVPASGEKVQIGLGLVQALLHSPKQLFFVRESCKRSLFYADRDMPQLLPSGKVKFDNRYNHYSDNLRYMIEALRMLGVPTFQEVSAFSLTDPEKATPLFARLEKEAKKQS